MSGTQTEHDSGPVAHRVARLVAFYISGYDPRGPAHYQRFYREEAAKQAAVNGLESTVGQRRNTGAHESAWAVTTPATVTEYRFLRYDDLMRTRWSKTAPALVRDILGYTVQFIRQRVFIRVLRTSWPMFLTICLAPAVLVLAVLAALLAGAAASLAVAWPLALATGVAVLAGLVALRPWLEPRTNAFWLGRILAFIASQGSGAATDAEDRIDIFAQRIARCLLEEQADEVLIIGHSVGTQLGVSACARALRMAGKDDSAISFLTLGHTIPLVGLQPGAGAFRTELAAIAADPCVTWLDVSAAIDSACFPLTDPVAASGLTQPDAGQPSPKLLSARFPKLFRPESYRKLKRDFSRADFQYLMAAELAGTTTIS